MKHGPDVSRRGAAGLALGLVSGLLLPSRARAAALQITPILIEMLGGARTSTIQVENKGGGATTMQVRVFSWSQPPDDDALTPTTDLAASPPIFAVPEGGAQIVRLVLRAAPGATEQAFRLTLDEIPGPAQGTAVVVALRVSLPVFVVPATARPAALEWRLGPGPDGKPLITAANTGGRYARITELKLRLPDGRALPTKLLGQMPYVLPNAERHWAVDDPRQAIRAGVPLKVTGTTNAGPLQETLLLKG
jgi:fimbrial chaperone protein